MTDLPDLPRVLHKREAAFQTQFNDWVKTNYHKTAAFELKQTNTNSLPFSSVQPHQLKALLQAKHSVLVYKIADTGFSKSPFDSFCLAGVPAFVVIKYPDSWYMIDIDVFISEMKISKRKSLTSQRAQQISEHFS